MFYKECETHSYGDNLEKMCFCSFQLCNRSVPQTSGRLNSPVLLWTLTLLSAFAGSYWTMLILWDPWPPFVLRHQHVEPGAEENSSHEPGSQMPHRQASSRPPKQPQLLLPIEDINTTTTILTNSDNYKPEKISSSTSKKPPASLSEKG